MKFFNKKKQWVAVAAVMLAGVFTACGGKDSSELKYVTDFKAEDYVALGKYKGVEVAVESPEVSDEYVEGAINYMLMEDAEYVPVTGRSVKSGDKVIIDFEGKRDGVAFEGGTSSGYELIIGSGQFIEGFEDGVIGMEIEETRDLDLKFPDSYKPNPDLAGVPVVFTVTLHEISEPNPPELTDEYVAGLGLTDCATVSEYKEYVRQWLTYQMQADYAVQKENAAIEAVEASSSFEELPEGMVNRIYGILTSNAAAYASMYQREVGEYVAAVYGGTAEDYQDTLHGQAEILAKRYIMLAAVADKEGITVTDEEVEENAVGENTDKEALKESLLIEKAAEFLGENAVAASKAAE
ncbi:MAG: trigger factor [Clostridium sp.]|nr:trigger factor [Clostridium sp.]